MGGKLKSLAAIPVGVVAATTTLPPCIPNGSWTGAPCMWPSTPPADCPFEQSPNFSGVSFSGRFGAYPTTAADTWYPSFAGDGSLFSSFADGRVCTTGPSPLPLPSEFVSLVWYWSEAAEDNMITTDQYPPAPSGYERVGVMGYAIALNGTTSNRELKLWYSHSDYFTTAGPADEDDARAANYTLIAPLGAVLPWAEPPPDPRPLPPTTSVNMPPGTMGWTATTLYYSSARNDHFTSPEPIPPGAPCLARATAQPPLIPHCSPLPF